MDSIRKPARGFTLIEVAIVVAIMTILLTLGLSLMNAQLSSAAYSVTKKRQDVIKDALIAYLGANRRLPCPYVPAPGTAVTGTASASVTFPGCPTFGVVPFATLGLAREVGEDGWGNLFSYWVYSDSAPACPGPAWDWGRSECFGEGKDGVNPARSAQQINDGTAGVAMPITDKSIAVIVSHGSNGLGAWAAQGTRNAAPTTCEEAHNATGTTLPAGCTIAPNTYYKGERPENDDVVAYLTAAEVIQTLVKQGTIKSATAKVNDDLQTLVDMAIVVKRSGISLSLLGININVSGCDSSVITTSMNAALSSPLDPWGYAYVLRENSGSNKFPICLSSKGGSPSADYCQTNGTCSTTIPMPALCRSIDEATFNSYTARTGGSC